MLLLFATVGNLAAQDRAADPSRSAFRVVFFGTGGARPAVRAASSNLILIKNKARLLVDAGSAAFTRLGEMNLNIVEDKMVMPVGP